jgi:hypothetical protein
VESSASDISTGLLKTETVKIGGAFTFSLAGTAAGDSTIFSDYPTPSVVSYADLYADARPADNSDFSSRAVLVIPIPPTLREIIPSVYGKPMRI